MFRNGGQAALAGIGVKLYGGISGNADDGINAYILGDCNYNYNEHREHVHGNKAHTRGEHGCGHGRCGNE